MNNHFIPYGQQWVDDSDIQAVAKVLRSDYLTQGPQIEQFENELCRYTGAKFCVAVANGTAALHLAVAALELKQDDEGITTPNTFVASANCLIYNGLTPKFADVDPHTYNINPAQVGRIITPKTKVIIPVHFAGQAADMIEIKKIATAHQLYVIEDAAHAIGSKYADGSQVGNGQYADMTTFSFHPVKTITCGEGGAITTNNSELYHRLKLLRSHGITKDSSELSKHPGPWYYEMQKLGYNYRLTDVQAALGLSQLAKLDQFAKRRREIVTQYNTTFGQLNKLTIPEEKNKNNATFHLYVVKINYAKIGKTRAEVMEQLKTNNVGTQVHYIPVHLQPYYQTHFGFKPGDLPEAERYYEQALSLPLYPKMTDQDVQKVIDEVTKIVS